MIRGSCLCGDVAWEAQGPLELMSHCHCSYCRKSHGAAFGTYGAARAPTFRWMEGEDRIRRYTSSPGFERPFCPRCGSVVAGDAQGDWVFMPVGNLDTDPGGRASGHIFAASKAPWYEISDDLPRFDEYPPPMKSPGLPVRKAAVPEREGTLIGSCLCGAVVYEVTGRFEGIVCCHCSRCRKAASAAHATNLFVAEPSLRFLGGEELLEGYRPPDAERFETVFCRSCGGPTPRLQAGIAMLRVPAGSLDTAPGVGPKIHIHVGSKASWFEITDELPQLRGGRR